MAEHVHFLGGLTIVPANAGGTTVTSTITTDVHGSYVQFIASTAEDIYITSLSVRVIGSTISSWVQIATGGAGSEVVRANLAIKSTALDVTGMIVPLIPFIKIPASTRVAIRVATSGSTAVNHAINITTIPVANIVNPVLAEVANPTGAVVADGANSATTFKTNLSATATNHWKDCYLKFTSGSLADQVKKVTGYNGTTKFVTTDAFTGTPAESSTFEIINQ